MNFLGVMGLLPFVGLPILITLHQMSFYEGVDLFILYSGVILSFLGGVHWYDAINRTESTSQLYLAMLPSIIAWLVIGFSHGSFSLIVLLISYLLLLLYDFRKLAMDAHYQQLRIILTGVVIGCHIAMLWLS